MIRQSLESAEGFRWDHVKRDADGVRWLKEEGLEPLVRAALTADDTRPRVTGFPGGVLVVLRGVNLNEDAQAEDMISVRLWLDENRAITVWLRPLRAVQMLLDAAEAGEGPSGPGDLAARLAFNLTETATPVVADLNERMGTQEEAMVDDAIPIDQAELAELRRILIVLRRYFGPQAEAIAALSSVEAEYISRQDRQRLAEAADRSRRLTEELDALTQRGQIIHEHLQARRSDGLNRQMFILSVVAALFLPLGLVTGLLGINVGGMPGAENPWAFWIVCALLVVFVAGQWVLFRWLGIFRRDGS